MSNIPFSLSKGKFIRERQFIPQRSQSSHNEFRPFINHAQHKLQSHDGLVLLERLEISIRTKLSNCADVLESLTPANGKESITRIKNIAQLIPELTKALNAIHVQKKEYTINQNNATQLWNI